MGGGQSTSATERGGFLLFLGLVSLALLAVVLPFLTPMLWAALAAIMFQEQDQDREGALGGARRDLG